MTLAVEHLTWPEALWLITAATGLFFAVLELKEARADRRQAERLHNGLRTARIVVANGYVYRNRIRVGIFAWWLLLGLFFGFLDPPEVPRLAGLLGFIATAMAWALIGAQEGAERRSLREIVASYERMAETDAAAETIEQRAAIVAAQLEIVAQEAALRLRTLAAPAERGMAVDQKRSADAAERAADSLERAEGP